MNSDQPVSQELIIRFLSGEASPEEVDQVNTWLYQDVKNREYIDQLRILWQSSENIKDLASISLEEDWEKVKLAIKRKTPQAAPHGRRPVTRMMYQLVRITAVITVLVAGYLIWPELFRYFREDTTTIIADGNITNVTLPDGSRVYLNKKSHLTYAKDFGVSNREVRLTGEAFFEVMKDEGTPFLVTTGHTVTRVAGTSFNVKGMHSSQVVVTVASGRVFFYNEADPATKLVMEQRDRGVWNEVKGLTKTVNEDVNFLSWKTGELVFDGASLSRVIHDLSRHYDQPIRPGSGDLEKCTLTTTFRHQKIEEVLEEMELALPVRIIKKKDTIIIEGEGCI